MEHVHLFIVVSLSLLVSGAKVIGLRPQAVAENVVHYPSAGAARTPDDQEQHFFGRPYGVSRVFGADAAAVGDSQVQARLAQKQVPQVYHIGC